MTTVVNIKIQRNSDDWEVQFKEVKKEILIKLGYSSLVIHFVARSMEVFI